MTRLSIINRQPVFMYFIYGTAMTPSTTTHSVYAKCVSFTRLLVYARQWELRVHTPRMRVNERKQPAPMTHTTTAQVHSKCQNGPKSTQLKDRLPPASQRASHSFVIFSRSKSIIELTSIFHCEFAANHQSDCWSIHLIYHAPCFNARLSFAIKYKL